jgi:3-oxoacyl-[acyl-carrier-protein] synthase-1
MSLRGLAIRASGLVTSVGFCSAASCAAMRAGIRNVKVTNLWDGESGTYLSAGKVPLPQWWIGVGKLAELCAPALHECFEAARPVPSESIPVLIGLPSLTRPCRLPDLDPVLLGELEHRLQFPLHPSSRLIPQERVSAVVALEEAGRLLRAGVATHCIVAGVDSLLQNDLCDYYLDKRRLLTPKNSNGFSPGEAAGAVLVTATAEPGDLQILGAGAAHERSTIESEDPLRGEGLAQAFGMAMREAGCEFTDLDYRITDLNGEHYRFKEMVFATMRYERRPRRRLFDLWHPIEFIGDVGAAIGPVVFAVALDASRKGYGIGDRILLSFGNDEGERAAVVIEHRPGRG